VLTDADFKTAALEQSKTIDILDFVKQDEIDPRYFETPYYLVPTKGGEKPYALLREAIRSTGSVGIGKIIIRQTQHLAGVKVIGDALVLEIMRFANELVDATEFNFPGRDAVRPQELQMAEQLVSNLAEPFDPTRYTDDYRANLMKVIKAKMKGKKPKLEEPEGVTPDSGVLDLMSRLRASLEEGSGKKGAVRAKRKAVAAGRKPAKARKRQTA
jgi:DNA end-binding protein Ku